MCGVCRNSEDRYKKRKARPLRPRFGGDRALLSGRPRARSGDLDGRPRLTRCTRARRYSLERPSRPVPWYYHGSVEPISPILPSCVERWQSTGAFPSPVGDQGPLYLSTPDFLAILARPTGRRGPAPEAGPLPRLAWPRGIRDAICKSRRILRLLQTRRPRTPGLARPSPCSLFPRLWNHRNRSMFSAGRGPASNGPIRLVVLPRAARCS